MTCAHAPNYDKNCTACMVRKIRSLRGPDPKTSRRMQLQMFAYMPQSVAAEVKEILKEERNASHTAA